MALTNAIEVNINVTKVNIDAINQYYVIFCVSKVIAYYCSL